MLRRAIVRLPGRNFAEGLTTSGLGDADYGLAVIQHQYYCDALEEIGLNLVRLPPDEQHPDSTFVEDTAVVTERGAVIARPGAASRQGEENAIRDALTTCYSELQTIEEPGTLDGGDVCQVDDHFFIGVSARTNHEGATQLARLLDGFGYTSTLVDIRELTPELLHLKSGLAYLDNNRLVVQAALATRPEFDGFEKIRLANGEECAANCLAFDKTVLVASAYPGFESQLRRLGYRIVALDMSEFQKMDGGLSCLSIRF